MTIIGGDGDFSQPDFESIQYTRFQVLPTPWAKKKSRMLYSYYTEYCRDGTYKLICNVTYLRTQAKSLPPTVDNTHGSIIDQG